MGGLIDFLNQYITNDSKKATHTSMEGGKWDIPSSKYKEFYKLLKKDLNKNVHLPPLTERIKDVMPFILDVDIKYKDLHTEKQFDISLLKEFIEFIVALLHDFLETDKYREVYIMEKSKPYPCNKGDYKSKDGIHILFPKIILDRQVYKLLMKQINSEECLPKLLDIFRKHSTTPPSNLDETLMDASFTGWQPYGCYKRGEEAYKLTHVLDIDSGDNASVKDPAMVDLMVSDLMIMKEMSMFLEGLAVNVEYTDLVKNQLKSKTTTTTSSSMVSEAVVTDANDPYANYYVDNNNIINPYQIVEEEELKLITNLCECFSKERATEYGKWLDVGLALHNTNSDKFLPVWEKFSLKYTRFASGASRRNCEQKWASFNNSNTSNPLTVGSIRYWSNHDDPEKYNKVMIENLGAQIEKSISHGPEAHHLIGLVVHKYYQGQFICVDIADDWYFFNGCRWKKTLKAHELKKRIHHDIYNIFHEYENKYKNMGNNEPDPDEKEKWQKKQAKCLTFMQKLLQENYVNTLIGALRHLFYIEGVAEKFDENLSLLGVDNGVIDLKEWVFREGRPEDYVTKTTGFEIPLLPIDGQKVELPIKLSDINTHLSSQIENYDIYREHLNDFIQQIIPIDAVRGYALRFLSKCLSGENRDEGFYIWTGSGGNGKSKMIELMQLVLGDYAGGLPVSLITKSRASSNSATPEMERTKGLRLVVMQEPEANESINIGLMKELTGNDKIYARGLFKEPIEFIPQFKLLLMCNDLPNIPTNDDGTWRRLEVVDFISRFLDDKSKLDDSKHVYKRDKQLKSKFEMWKKVFFGFLLEEWMKYDKEGITIPPQVNSKTKSYRNENDILGQWIDQSCEIVDNNVLDNGLELAQTCFEDLFWDYKQWCQKQGYPCNDSHKKKTKDDLMKWQEKSKYGLSMGKTKKEGRPNGSTQKPYFDLKVIVETE